MVAYWSFERRPSRFSNCNKGTLLLATGSMDGTVQIWDAKSMELRCTVKEPRKWIKKRAEHLLNAGNEPLNMIIKVHLKAFHAV